MTEEQVKKHLSFLIQKYNMKYARQDFKNHDPMITETYSFYNENGCFTISNLAQRGDVDYIYLDNIELLKDYMFSSYSEKQKSYINITSAEKQIWDKYESGRLFKKIFFWNNTNKVLSALAEVIEEQIIKSGQFYGVKISK